jgi:hypothetical protein
LDASLSTVWEFTPVTSTPSRARRVVAERLRVWDVGSVDERDLVAFVVDELVTNAVVHARTPLRLSVRLLGGGVEVELEVFDGSSLSPLVGPSAEGGCWGLRLVDKLAESTSWTPTGTGKSVRAVVHCGANGQDVY